MAWILDTSEIDSDDAYIVDKGIVMPPHSVRSTDRERGRPRKRAAEQVAIGTARRVRGGSWRGERVGVAIAAFRRMQFRTIARAAAAVASRRVSGARAKVAEAVAVAARRSVAVAAMRRAVAVVAAYPRRFGVWVLRGDWVGVAGSFATKWAARRVFASVVGAADAWRKSWSAVIRNGEGLRAAGRLRFGIGAVVLERLAVSTSRRFAVVAEFFDAVRAGASRRADVATGMSARVTVRERFARKFDAARGFAERVGLAGRHVFGIRVVVPERLIVPATVVFAAYTWLADAVRAQASRWTVARTVLAARVVAADKFERVFDAFRGFAGRVDVAEQRAVAAGKDIAERAVVAAANKFTVALIALAVVRASVSRWTVIRAVMLAPVVAREGFSRMFDAFRGFSDGVVAAARRSLFVSMGRLRAKWAVSGRVLRGIGVNILSPVFAASRAVKKAFPVIVNPVVAATNRRVVVVTRWADRVKAVDVWSRVWDAWRLFVHWIPFREARRMVVRPVFWEPVRVREWTRKFFVLGKLVAAAIVVRDARRVVYRLAHPVRVSVIERYRSVWSVVRQFREVVGFSFVGRLLVRTAMKVRVAIREFDWRRARPVFRGAVEAADDAWRRIRAVWTSGVGVRVTFSRRWWTWLVAMVAVVRVGGSTATAPGKVLTDPVAARTGVRKEVSAIVMSLATVMTPVRMAARRVVMERARVTDAVSRRWTTFLAVADRLMTSAASRLRPRPMLRALVAVATRWGRISAVSLVVRNGVASLGVVQKRFETTFGDVVASVAAVARRWSAVVAVADAVKAVGARFGRPGKVVRAAADVWAATVKKPGPRLTSVVTSEDHIRRTFGQVSRAVVRAVAGRSSAVWRVLVSPVAVVGRRSVRAVTVLRSRVLGRFGMFRRARAVMRGIVGVVFRLPVPWNRGRRRVFGSRGLWVLRSARAWFPVSPRGVGWTITARGGSGVLVMYEGDIRTLRVLFESADGEYFEIEPDPKVTVYDESGEIVREDVGRARGRSVEYDFEAPGRGVFTVRVTATVGGQRVSHVESIRVRGIGG